MAIKFLRKAGYTTGELLLVTTIVTSISTGSYIMAKKKAVETVCKNNLHQIQSALTMFLTENNDRLPDGVFYPKEMSSDKAIHNILNPYIRGNVFVCPALPDELQKRGLTYLWNDIFSGKRINVIQNADKEWLMVEMTAVSKDIPPPHAKGYTILYLDGHIDYLHQPPDFTLPEAWYNFNKYCLKIGFNESGDIWRQREQSQE
jgi:prepilin-type processing-associated H-X9-DG protein